MTLSPTQRRTLTWLAIAAGAALLLWLLAPVLTPFLIGAVLAYALHPLVEKLVGRDVPRVLAVIVVETAVIVALLALLLLIVPIMSRELPLLREQIPILADRLNHSLAPWLAQFGINVALDIASIKAFVVKYLDANLEDWLATALASARIGGSFALAIIGNMVLVPVVLFFLLVDWSWLVERAREFVPPRARPGADGFGDECDDRRARTGAAGRGADRPGGVHPLPGLRLRTGTGAAVRGAPVRQLVRSRGGRAGLRARPVSRRLRADTAAGRQTHRPVAAGGDLLAARFRASFGFAGVLVALPLAAVTTVAIRRMRGLYLGSRLYRE